MLTATKRPPIERQRRAPDFKSRDIEARVDEILCRRPAVGLAVGVVRGGRPAFFRAHGLADISTFTPITEDTAFRIASITKTFTAIAVMQLWEQGRIDLDAPANEYLRAYRLLAAKAGDRPATVQHLLTHTAGIPENVHPWGVLRPDFGESVPAGQRLPTLAEYYGGGLPLVAEPGTRFAYGNHGFATLGQLVADVTGEPFEDYLREHIFEPLGMVDTDIVRSERVKSRLATGYALRRRGPRPVPQRDMITAGAASIYSTPRDMARYLAALLGGGTNEHGSALEPATVARMFEAGYRPDPRLAGMGLGFFRANLGGHPAIEHEGLLPGFNSHILVAPDDGVGVMAFTNGAPRAAMWLPAETRELLEHLLGLSIDAIRTDVPQRPEVWGELCGWYRLAGPLTDVRMRALLGAGVEVFARGGELRLRALSPVPPLYRGFPLRPDDPNDPYVFRVDLSRVGVGSIRVVFSRTPGLGITAVHLDAMPITMTKQAPETNPRLWASVGVAVLTSAMASYAINRRHAPA